MCKKPIGAMTEAEHADDGSCCHTHPPDLPGSVAEDAHRARSKVANVIAKLVRSQNPQQDDPVRRSLVEEAIAELGAVHFDYEAIGEDIEAHPRAASHSRARRGIMGEPSKLTKFERNLKRLIQRTVMARVDLARAELGEIAISIALHCREDESRKRWLEGLSSIQFELNEAHAMLDMFTFPRQTLADFLEEEADVEDSQACEAVGVTLADVLARELLEADGCCAAQEEGPPLPAAPASDIRSQG